MAGHFRAVGLGDPYIVMAQVYGDADPRPYGMDAAAGFPPHNTSIDDVNIRDTLTTLIPSIAARSSTMLICQPAPSKPTFGFPAFPRRLPELGQ